jgi:hypothetical protein
MFEDDIQGMNDLQGMVERNEPIFVVNRSARVLGKAHLLVLEFPNPTGQGRGQTVKIPPIKYPINLTRRVAPPQAIPMSTAFVNWVNQGVLEIIPAARAREILSDPEAQAAVRGAYDKLSRRRGDAIRMREQPNFKVRHGGAQQTRAYADLGESDLTAADFSANAPGAFDIENMPGVPKPEKQGALKVAEASQRVQPKIQQFCSDLVEDPSLKGNYLIELKSWDEAVLSDDDIGYMLQQLSDFDNICSYLRAIKAQRVTDELEAQDNATTRKKRKKKGKRPSADSLMDDLD